MAPATDLNGVSPWGDRRRIYVTTPGFDDIGNVLRSMNIKYQPFSGSYDCSLLFVNCGTTSTLQPRKVAEYVNAGGCLYVSDLAGDQIVLAERDFLDEISALAAEQRLALPGLEPSPVPEPSPVTEPPARPAIRPEPRTRAVEAPAQRPALPEPAPAASPRPAVVPVRVSDGVPAPRRQVAAVLYDGAEVVSVDQRTPLERLTRQKATDADALDAIQRDGRAVGLVFLVFVPDDGVVPRAVAKRRNEIALDLDRAFASVDVDIATGRPAQVTVEVFSATNPVRKHGVLHRAGELIDSALPKVEIEYFSLSETVVPLSDAARRTSRALRARGVEVVSLHLVFLAAMRFPDDESTRGDGLQLLKDARVTWVDFSPPARHPPSRPMPPSQYGVHVLTDKEDVMAVIKQESGVLYRFAPPVPPGPAEAPRPAADQPRATSPGKDRRWWPFGSRSGSGTGAEKPPQRPE